MVYRAGVLVACMALQACMGTSQPTIFTPANFPPADFTGLQYADNAGCAFIRAGNGGVVSWAPRLNPDRTQVCGLTPTFAGAAPEPVAVAAPEPVMAEPVVAETDDAAADGFFGQLFGQSSAPLSNPDPAAVARERFHPPAGFVRVWTDGRLNPDRGVRNITLEEAAAMGLR